MAAAKDALSTLRSWWGEGWRDREFIVPTYSSLTGAHTALFDTGFDSLVRVRFKQLTKGELARALDKYELSALWGPNVPQLAGIEAKTAAGRNTYLSASIRVLDPTEEYRLPVLSVEGAYNYVLNKGVAAKQGLFQNAVASVAVRNVSLDGQSKNALAPEQETSAGVDLYHSMGSFGLRMVQTKPAACGFLPPRVYLSGTLGKAGFTVGAEVAQTKGELVDYNAAVQYQRKNALAVTVGTQNRCKNLILSSIAYFGPKQQLAVACTAVTSTADPLSAPRRWMAGFQYQLPAHVLGGSTIKAKFDTGDAAAASSGAALNGSAHQSRVAASINSILPNLGCALGLNVSAPVSLPWAPASETRVLNADGVKFGVSLSVGDNYDEPDAPLVGSRSSLIVDPVGACPACCRK